MIDIYRIIYELLKDAVLYPLPNQKRESVTAFHYSNFLGISSPKEVFREKLCSLIPP